MTTPPVLLLVSVPETVKAAPGAMVRTDPEATVTSLTTGLFVTLEMIILSVDTGTALVLQLAGLFQSVSAVPVQVLVSEKVNVPSDVAVPPGVVTETVPVVPLPTKAVMEVELTKVNEVAAVPPKLTAVTPVKLVPVMVTVVPLPAVEGVKELIVGAPTHETPAVMVPVLLFPEASDKLDPVPSSIL